MKYIKLINELKSETYRSAISKLRNIGHKNRANKMEDWNLKTKFNEYKKYGIYKLIINESGSKENLFKIEGDFTLEIYFDPDFIGKVKLVKDKNNFDIIIRFLIYGVPSNVDLKNELYFKNGSNNFYCDGSFDLFCAEFKLTIEYGCVKCCKLEFNDLNNDGYYKVYFGDRKSVIDFKKLLNSILTDDSFDYPSIVMRETRNFLKSPTAIDRNMYIDLDDCKSPYSELERIILSAESMSSDYGLDDFGILANALKMYNINRLYKD